MIANIKRYAMRNIKLKPMAQQTEHIGEVNKMMTAVEKASKLISYYLPFCNDNLIDAKYCALIAVEEILDTIRIHLMEDPSTEEVVKFVERRVIYWQEVKQEIEKL